MSQTKKSKNGITHWSGLAILGGLFSAVLLMNPAASLANDQSMSRYSALPPLAYSAESSSSVMLTLSVDHQLFMKAYNDYSDLTGDGLPNTTFEESYPYAGYFDSTLCYEYGTVSHGTETVSTFVPVGPTAVGTRCATGQWHGNFLNWVSMTRIDLVRQVLYGGYRSIDAPGLTVLERAYLPQDAHSFAKYVPADINLNGLAVVPAANSFCDNEDNEDDLRCQGVTFCNTTRPPADFSFSQDVQRPPWLRVVRGNYSLWDAGERFQCLTSTSLFPSRSEFGDDGERYFRAALEVSDASELKIITDNDWYPAAGFEASGANFNIPENTGIQAFDRSPLYGDVESFEVRVVACDSRWLPQDGTCRSYPAESVDNNHKPTGLLHSYGADSSVRFGLLSGSYNSNKDYGILRKNIANFGEEVNPDGTFNFNLTESIVNNLNALRIVDYRYRDNAYDVRGTYRSRDPRPGGLSGGQVACDWGRPDFENGACRSWGNPFSELLLESYRYMAGAESPRLDYTSARILGEENLLPGLSIASWSLPTTGDENAQSAFACSNKAVLGFNASAVSFDWSTQFAGRNLAFYDLPYDIQTAGTLAQLTDNLGVNGTYFVGKAGNDEDGQCSPKVIGGETDDGDVIPGLGSARGTCPETPRLDGGYLGAGLASAMRTTENIRTFGVSLSDAIPRIRVPLANDAGVEILPACQNAQSNELQNGQPSNSGGNCGLVNFKVVEDPVLDLPAGVDRAGQYFIGWEDSEQGGDYDMDASGILRYELRGNELTITTSLIYNGTPDILLFGFVLSGAGDQDGVYFPTRTQGGFQNIGTPQADTRTEWCRNNVNLCPVPTVQDEEQVREIRNVQTVIFSNVQGSGVEWLPSPLELAATVGSGVGAEGHANVENPANLRAQLDQILDGLTSIPTPGTGAAPATNIVGGEGLALSSLYAPQIAADGETVNWIGRFNALYFKDGRFWEDCDGSGVITDNDCVVEIRLDEATNQTVFDRYRPTTGFNRDESGRIQLVAANDHPLADRGLSYSDLQPLWSADNWLSSIANPNAQRTYGSTARNRHILTAIPQAQSNIVLPGNGNETVFPFTEGSFDVDPGVGIGGNNYRLLNVGDRDAAQDLVNYIRGDETIEGARNRTLGSNTYLLGDIMHSSAAIVGRPSSFYDSPRIGDTTYTAYAREYRNRRNVTYVGSNSGMLHAFNGGFFNGDADAPGYFTQPTTGVEVAEHALGAELWAYVPYNLLPHLKWLQNPNYSHVYYVDGDVQTFDVNIFTPSETHINGWGTIIVARMRLGGGDYTLETGRDERTLRSAYIIFDVTNPEEDPKLLGEITHENLGFTTSNADVVSFRQPDATTGTFDDPVRNDWYLVFGSGPRGENALHQGTSNQDAKLFFLNLNDLANGTGGDLIQVETGEANSYVGGVTAVDWNGDFNTDMIYFGTVGTEPGGGALMQMPVSHNELQGNVTELLSLENDASLPFSSAPLVVRDFSEDGYWVYAGTGKLLVRDDLLPDNIGQNWLYGVRVNNDDYDGTVDNGERWLTSSTVPERRLANITGASVTISGQGESSGFSVDVVGSGISADFPMQETILPEDVERVVRENYQGWRKQLINSNELMFSSPTFAGTTLAASSFSPLVGAGDECQATGRGRLYWLNLFTGLPQTDNRFVYVNGVPVLPSELPEGTEVSDVAIERDSPITIGSGGPEMPLGDGGGGLDSATSEGPPTTPVRRAWRELSNEDLR